jgi:hypothetical protein
MKTLLQIKRLLYQMITLTLAITATFFEVSISSLILGTWCLLGAVGLFSNNLFLLRILHHDFDVKYHEETRHKRPIQVAIALALAVFFFSLPLIYTSIE